MPDGFNLGDLNQVLKQVKERIPGQQEAPPQWSIWDRNNMPSQGPATRPELPPGFPRQEIPQVPNMRPEQMQGTRQADRATQQAVYQAVEQAQRQSYRSESAKLYMQAINIANDSQDASLQAMSKVEFGLANLSWGYSQQGFKWILEAGSNNPTLYNPQMNQSFLRRLAQTGMPQSAVDMLMANGQKDPAWYVNDTSALQRLDQAMTGPSFVAPRNNIESPRNPQEAQDPFAPPQSRRPENFNPNLEPPMPAGPWMKEQFGRAMQSAAQEKDWRRAFVYYKQAVDMADRSNDSGLQATARVETGLALVSWGNVESGFKWLLDAGSKDRNLYDERYNGAYINRLAGSGISKQAIDVLMTNGQQNPDWHLRDPQAAGRLASLMRSPQQERAPVKQETPYFTPVAPELTRPQQVAPEENPQGRRRSPFQ